jgi:predicted phosphodiesterase
MIVKGEHDGSLGYKDTLTTKIGNIKIGIINGQQLKPNCDEQSLLGVL